ncbi:hypothetical protein HV175_13220 [Klebsiella oxytoca]|nr:hypothetical protein HV175_13220 [Klebsiella oxytoca]
MTKSTITREQLEEWVAQFDEDGGCDATDRQLEALIRQSLAAMDSEPVAWAWHHSKQWHITNDEERVRDLVWDGVKVEPLYRHAQPAPVVLADGKLRELFDAWFASDCSFDLSPEASEADNIAWRESYWYVWKRCRAAMLQAGNSPVIPEGYVMVPKEPTREILDEFDSIIDYGAEDSEDAWRRLLAASPQEVK